MFRFQPVAGLATNGAKADLCEEGNQIAITLADDDDALTMSTCLADEFAYAHHTLLALGVESQEALRWLDDVRKNGLRSRFSQAR
ncbi:MAG: hypothetical protein GY822_23740 [Deltaproteobacteria bacterium]|nr:hypothetical protein [Deltaproteobacteria bacterium]